MPKLSVCGWKLRSWQGWQNSKKPIWAASNQYKIRIETIIALFNQEFIQSAS